MIICANFKSNLNKKITKEYLHHLNIFIEENSIKDTVIVAPPFTAFDVSAPNIILASQNIYPNLNGAFTGEITLNHLQEFGINTVIIGHSERRSALCEDNSFIKDKFNFLKEHNINIIFCVGESLKVRESGTTLDFLSSQLKDLDLSYKNLIIAYEPIWAIGSGKNAKSADIKEVHDHLKSYDLPIIYGGSVNASNAKKILCIDGVDGLLIGGASLDVNSFCNILQISKDFAQT